MEQSVHQASETPAETSPISSLGHGTAAGHAPRPSANGYQPIRFDRPPRLTVEDLSQPSCMVSRSEFDWSNPLAWGELFVLGKDKALADDTTK